MKVVLKSSTKSAGFTLIELVIVIVLLGILAVTAAPKFISLEKDAKAADLNAVAGAMRAGISLVHARAIVEGESKGSGSIQLNGVTVPLLNGYPSVSGGDSFTTLHGQVSSWLEIDAVDRNTARDNRAAAVFFTDKSSRDNQIFVFFSEDYDQKSVNFKCFVRYENASTPTVTVQTSQC